MREARASLLPTLLLSLLLGAPAAVAQPSAEADADPEASAAEETTGAEDGGGTAADAPPESDDSSPFDYQSSEEISEDLSVSFPVDI